MLTSLISKRRTCLMAIAMIWIGINHSFFPFHFKPAEFILSTCGYCGVDVFVFLSGFGLYYACKKKPTYIEYLKRRIIRIYPYNIVIAIFGGWLYKQGFLMTLLDVLGLSIFFRSNLLFWFTSFIIIISILYPLYYYLFEKNVYSVTTITIIIILIICFLTKTHYYHVSYVLYRVISLCLGTLFAYFNDNNILRAKHYYLFIILMIIGWLLLYYMYHNMGNDIQHVAPVALIVPGLIIILSWIIEKIVFIQKPLNYIGQYTFQFYLIHEKLLYILYLNYEKLFISGINFDYWINILALVGSFIFAIIYKKLIDSIMNIIINR